MTHCHCSEIVPEAGGIRLLLVEDHPGDRQAVLRFIEENKLARATHSVSTVVEAREALAARRFDLTLLDASLSDGAGIEVLHAAERTPVVFVAPADAPETAVAAMKLGARDYLIKDREWRYLALLPMTIERVIKQERADQAIRESEARLYAIVQNTPNVAVQGYDLEGRVCFWNEASARMFGFSAREALGKTLDQLIHTPEEAANFVKILREISGTGKSVGPAEYHFRRRDGGEAWCLSTTFEIPAHGSDFRFICMDVDITERKKAEEALRRSEELFRTIVEDQTEMIVRWRPDGTRTFVNQAYCRLFGKTFDELVGSNFYPLVKQEYREGIRRKIQSLTPANPIATEIHESVTPTGEVRWQEWTDRGLFDAEGRLVELQSTGRDITQRRLLEEQLRQAQKMEAIGRLAGGIAHDFNNILGAILGNAQLAHLELEQGHPARDSFEKIQKSSLRAKGLIQQILAFSRQQMPERKVVCLAPIVQEAVQLLRATIPTTVELNVEIEPKAPHLLADATQIEQILVNLVTNAWQSMEGKPGRVEIRVQTAEVSAAASLPGGPKPGRYACLLVSDTGPGMNGATLQRIYEPFFTTKAPGQGTGLGLAVVHGIVQNHDGVIHVASQPAAGTTFRLYFPLVEAAEDEAPVETSGEPLRGGGRRVLCIDDEEPMLLIVQLMLKRLGYEATVVDRPSDALKVFREDPARFDVVITDMNMPGANGLQVTEEILKIRPNACVILCSGCITDKLKEQAQQAGIQRIIHKPYTLDELSACIHQALSSGWKSR